MSDNEKALTVKDAMYRTAKDLESGALWTSQAIASIAELAGIDKRCTHSQALMHAFAGADCPFKQIG